jgi:hypothetical protein
VAGGVATIRLFTSSAADSSGVFRRPQVCAAQSKINGSTDLYQLYRMKADAVDGYKVAWLLWPRSGVWRRDGEIDFPEADLNDGTVSAFHAPSERHQRQRSHFGSAVTLGDWHTHAMEWTPNRCEFFIDGKSIGKSTSRIPNTPMRFVCQNETELNSTYPAHAAVARVAVKDDRLLRENPCRMRGVRQGADIGAADGVCSSGVAVSCADATSVSGTADLCRFHRPALG